MRSYNYQKNIYEYNKILEELVNENNDLCTLINMFEITKDGKMLLMMGYIYHHKVMIYFQNYWLKKLMKNFLITNNLLFFN